MTAVLRERLTKAFEKAILESHESSKEMIANNVTDLCDGHENLEPGEFGSEEITDMNNLVNKADNANTNGSECECEKGDSVNVVLGDPLDVEDDVESIVRELVDISTPEEEHEEEEHHEELKRSMFGESAFVDAAFKILMESDYAGPLDFVPDTRLNASDVVKALKAKVGDGSEGVHVDLDYDEEGNKIYQVSQIEKDKLPEELEVVNVKLKLGDHGYSVEKVKEDFPVKKD